MLSLVEKYWSWRKEPKRTFKTEGGFTVKKWGDKWVVKAMHPKHYIDLKNTSFSWPASSGYFRDCLASKEYIEERFGKFLDYPAENKA